MSSVLFPWLEFTLALPLVGAAVGMLIKTPSVALRCCLGILVGMLLSATATALSYSGSSSRSSQRFEVDELSMPMLPVFALLHLVTMLGTAKSRVSPAFCVRVLLAAFLTLAALTCRDSGTLLVLVILAVLLPFWDLRSRRQRTRGYLIHMSLFVALLIAGWSLAVGETTEWGFGILMVALLLRGGIVPLHGWLPTLFKGASYGSAMLFVLPLLEVLLAIRLMLVPAPEWILNAASAACLATAIYGGGMAIVQNEVRRFYAHLCVSQTSLVMFAVLLHTSNGLTAALCLWMSTILSLAGLAFAVRALEARFGMLSLREYHGYYEQVPGLAICFLLTGLASVGFPGTIGFVPMELLISGSVDQGLVVSFALAVAAMLNAIAIMRAYFALFTGKRPTTSVSLQVTPAERVGIVVITLVVLLGGWFSPEVVASRHRVADLLLQTPATQSAH